MTDNEFKRNVRYFWEKNENPNFIGYDPERCLKLMPQFSLAYAHFVLSKLTVNAALEKETPDD